MPVFGVLKACNRAGRSKHTHDVKLIELFTSSDQKYRLWSIFRMVDPAIRGPFEATFSIFPVTTTFCTRNFHRVGVPPFVGPAKSDNREIFHPNSTCFCRFATLSMQLRLTAINAILVIPAIVLTGETFI